MQSFALTSLYCLLCLLVVQANVFLGWYLYRTREHIRIKARFVKVQSLADLQSLDSATPYNPADPPDLPNLWGHNDSAD